MQLPQRKGEDRFIPAGRYRQLEESLRRNPKLAQVQSLIISAFDRRTRMLPFVTFDWYTVPCGPRSIAGALVEAGMAKTRCSLQLWNPRLRTSEARMEGRTIDMLGVSSLQVHSAASYRVVEDAWRLGDARPLILAGGPKAIYEPMDFFGLGPQGDMGADVAVTGEEPVLLELLAVLSEFGAEPGKMRAAFARARQAGALRDIPGLVYGEDGRCDGKHLIYTGAPRLLRDLDELPMPILGFRTIEPAHHRTTLSSKAMTADALGKRHVVVAILITRGCKFDCHYCSVPGYNYHSYRRKSAGRVVEEFVQCYQQLHSRYFFGTDDNFFNDRRYAQELLTAMGGATVENRPLGRYIKFATEATVADAYKCRDLFPIARHGRAGLWALWMGVEDLSGVLVDKGQAPTITREVFARMRENDICPVIMMMHHDRQPLYSPGKLTGLIDQVKYLHQAGALGLQCTLANPAIGSRWVNETYRQGLVYGRIGGKKIEDVECDGNHIAVAGRVDPLRMQWNVLRAYTSFYNPWNLMMAMRHKKEFIRNKYVLFQLWGMVGLVRTVWRLKGYLWRLWWGPIERVRGWPEKYRRAGSPFAELIAGEEAKASAVALGTSKAGTGQREMEPKSVV
ncbi:MAG: hypothetical protein WC975_11500 [Phycisphaerae bacterium]